MPPLAIAAAISDATHQRDRIPHTIARGLAISTVASLALAQGPTAIATNPSTGLVDPNANCAGSAQLLDAAARFVRTWTTCRHPIAAVSVLLIIPHGSGVAAAPILPCKIALGWVGSFPGHDS